MNKRYQMNKSIRFELRMNKELLDRIDAWRRVQPDIPSKASAIRILVCIGLSKTE